MCIFFDDYRNSDCVFLKKMAMQCSSSYKIREVSFFVEAINVKFLNSISYGNLT